MVSKVVSSVVFVLCVILLPAVLAEHCASYVDRNGYSHNAVQCSPYYCCGDCTNRQCCRDKSYRISQQDRCPGSGGHDKKSRLATLLGSILGSIFPILLCVGLVICCVAPCCLFYKKCRKGRSQAAPGNAIFNVPLRPQPNPPPPQPHPSGYPSQPGYQPVPAQPGFGGPSFPSAPPSYGNPNHPPVAYPSLPFPGLQYAEPPSKTDEEAPQPYNPSYPSTQ